jgi:Mrp family chromosome partitioning ATPase
MSNDPVREISNIGERLFVLPGASAPRVVVFADAEPTKGSNCIFARIGEALATSNKGTVCVVDANLQSPSAHRYFGIDDHFGLADALLRPDPVEKFCRFMDGSRLGLITAGAKANMAERIREINRRFDFVLIEAPPLSECNHAIVLGQTADGLVMIVEANATRRERAKSIAEAVKAAGVNLLGVVLNNRMFPIPQRIYSIL